MSDQISHYLPNKTTRDCVQYYYLNKKSVAFKEAYKKLELKHRRIYHLDRKNEKILQVSGCWRYYSPPPEKLLSDFGG